MLETGLVATATEILLRERINALYVTRAPRVALKDFPVERAEQSNRYGSALGITGLPSRGDSRVSHCDESSLSEAISFKSGFMTLQNLPTLERSTRYAASR